MERTTESQAPGVHQTRWRPSTPSTASDTERPTDHVVRQALFDRVALQSVREWLARWRVRHMLYLASSSFGFVTLLLNLARKNFEHDALRFLPIAPWVAGVAACGYSGVLVVVASQS